MARENQGLQIALIIFVMLTVVLGVTNFLAYRNGQELRAKSVDDKNQADTVQKACDAALDECKELKRMIGAPTTQSLEGVKTKYKDDMTVYGGPFPADARAYSRLLPLLTAGTKHSSEQLVVVNNRHEKLQAEHRVREQMKEGQLDTFKAKIVEVGTHTRNVETEASTERTRMEADQKQLMEVADRQRREGRRRIDQANAALDEATKKMTQLAAIVADRNQKLKITTHQLVEAPVGEIRWVNQQNGSVWLSLGRADGLERQVTFGVFPAGATRIDKSARKGSIEVTKILSEHMAEARIADSKLTDPIMPGDKIYSPMWLPGTRKHFGLIGIMDIDNNGRDNHAAVRSLITLNNGIVDCDLRENGKVDGELTLNTNIVVLGQQPSSKGNPDLYRRYMELYGKAQQFGIRTISLGELKEQMGYRSQSMPPPSASGAGAGAPTRRGSPNSPFQRRQAPPGDINSAF